MLVLSNSFLITNGYTTEPPINPPSIPIIRPPPLEPVSPVDTTGDTTLDTSGDSAFPPITEFAGTTNSRVGDFLQLKDDYLKISVGNSGNSYIKSEIGGVALTDFESKGLAGDDGDTQIYKYEVSFEFYVLVYSAYPTNYFFDLSSKTMNRYWLLVINENLGIEQFRDIYCFEYSYYDPSGASTKANGGAYEIPIETSFSLPFAGNTYGDYYIEGIESNLLTLETSPNCYETGVISETDIRYSSTSSEATRLSTNVNTEDYSDGNSDVQDEIDDKSLGWNGESEAQVVTDNSQLAQGMATNSRIASGDSYSLKGNFLCSVGAHAYHYRTKGDYGRMTMRVDDTGLFQSEKVTEYVKSTTFERTVSLGTQNKYVKQKLCLTMEVLIAEKDLSAEITPDEDTEMIPPYANETIYYDDYIGGDEDVELVLSDSKTLSTTQILLIGVAVIGIAIFLIILRSRGRVVVIRA